MDAKEPEIENKNFEVDNEFLSSKKMNKKVLNTKKNLSKSLVSLLEEKEIDKIDVSELCQKANINRTTFYKHYTSLLDLLDELINEFFKRIKKLFTTETTENTTAKIALLLKYLKQNRQFVSVIMNTDFHEKISNKLIQLDFVKELLDKNIKFRKSIYINNDYYVGFIISGWYAVIKKWVNEGCYLNENTLARLLTSIY